MKNKAAWKKYLPLDKKAEQVNNGKNFIKDNLIQSEKSNVTDSSDNFERVSSKSPEKNLQKSYPEVNFFKIIPISSIIGKSNF